MTSSQLRRSAFDKQGSQALWIAEAGLQKYIYNLAIGTYHSGHYPNLNENMSVSGEVIGSYSVDSTYNAGTSTFTVTSTGTVDQIDRQVVQNIIVSGTIGIASRAIHADGSMLDFEDSNGTINGNIGCHVTIANEELMTIVGTVEDGLVKINPTLDFPTYEALADADGQSVTTALTFNAAGSPYTGVWYTTQSVTIEDDATINGSIFAQGSINFANEADNVTISPSNNYPALATQGSITSTDVGTPVTRVGLQNSTINGLIWSVNNITFNYIRNTGVNTTVFNGTIISGNNINLKYSDDGSFTINQDASIFVPMPPGLDLGPSGTVLVTPKDWDENIPVI